MLLLVGILAGFAPTQDLASVQLTDDPARSAFVVTIGPMDLPAGHEGQHEMHTAVLPPVGSVYLPHEAYLYGFDYEVVDQAGNRLPSSLLHHLNLIDPTHRELFLPISQRMLAVGTETGAQSMPWWLFGYPVSKGQEMVVSVMMHNPTHEAYSGVSLRLFLNYVPAGKPWPLFRVYPYQLDVAFPAGDKSFDVPPGRFSRSYEAHPTMAGRIMVVGGHLHPYATSLKFEDVTVPRVIWEGKPIEGPKGDLEGVTVGHLYRRLGVKIYPDHVYRVTVTYDNTTGQTLTDGGMGLVAGVFIPSGETPWPLADAGAQLYQLDRKHYERELHGKYPELLVAFEGKKADSDMAGMHHKR